MVKFKVEGIHDGINIDEEVEAVSVDQAKLRAGMKSGMGRNMSKYMKDRNIKIRRLR